MENEKDTEAYLRDEVRKLGGKAYKFVSPGQAGVPDRICILPGGRVFFVETKSEGKKSTDKQRQQQAALEALGCTVYADIDTKAKVREVIANEIQAAQLPVILHQQDSQ
jgi:hypothetical protein